MRTTEPEERWDPLGQGVRLAHSRTFWPLGFRLDVATNDAQALELVERAFPRRVQRFPDRRLSLRIVAGEGEAFEAPPVYRASGRLLSLAADARHALAADMDPGEAVLWTTRAALDDPARFVRWWIAGPVLQMLAHRALTPVHAACVALEGRGLLLCGPPGAGKSVLAWAAGRAGMTFVSDDVSYLVRGEPGRALGRPELLRLKPSAVGLVPGLERFEAVPDDAPGERVYELDPERALGLKTSAECRAAGLVLLERTEGADAKATPIAGEETLPLLDATLPVGAPGVTEEQTAGLLELAAAPCWRLRYAAAEDGARELDRLFHSASLY